MDLRFGTKDLEALYTEEKGAERYPPEVIVAFFELTASIASATDERDLRMLRGARLEKLKGKSGYYAMRLNKQWRLMLTFDPPKGVRKAVVVLEISKHYGD